MLPQTCTLLRHWYKVVISSSATMSTSLMHGAFSFIICFFTMVSKAMSGVNRPVLEKREMVDRKKNKSPEKLK